MLSSARQYWDLGFAVHWLHPRAKRPIRNGWTKGPRQSWDQLGAAYRDGLNVGTRLGGDDGGEGFLAVIDCDVKGDANATDKMLERLASLLPPGVEKAPTVASGRGGGSRHLYIRTTAPVAPQVLARAENRVRVRMPSSNPSADERASLSAAELAEGWRLRPAWEISLMGRGQQVVLPPSIHPDTGKPYLWGHYPKSWGEIPLVDATAANWSAARERKDSSNGFSPVGVDLLDGRLDSSTVDAILSGRGVTDRSTAIFHAAGNMVRAGFTDAEILSVLTDPHTFLGSAAHEHSGQAGRARAANWVYRYSLKKAREENAADRDFKDAVVVEKTTTEEDAEAESVDLFGDSQWMQNIERGGPTGQGAPKPTMRNVIVVLEGVCGAGVFRENRFTHRIEYGVDAPWGGTKGVGIADRDIRAVRRYLAEQWGFDPGTDKVFDAVACIAEQSAYHPVRDYLDGLQWDGVARVDGWLQRYLRATGDERYLDAVGRKTLVGMVARVMDPGCKFDQALVLEGPQGIGKSSAARILAGQWHTDATLNFADKDSVLGLSGHWVVELGELAGLGKADVETLKAFVSRQVDKIRKPYGRVTEDLARQCVFLGTTNSAEYLRDDTGGRRWWPVLVGELDRAALSRDRDQLFAEAAALWAIGEPLYLDDREVRAVAVVEQAERTPEDALVDALGDFMGKSKFGKNKFRLLDLYDALMSGGEFSSSILINLKNDMAGQKRLADALRKLKFNKKIGWSGGKTVRFWEKT